MALFTPILVHKPGERGWVINLALIRTTDSKIGGGSYFVRVFISYTEFRSFGTKMELKVGERHAF